MKKKTTASFAPMDLQQQIEKRAYGIWLAKGCPEGCALDHWVQAERELAPVTAHVTLQPNKSMSGNPGHLDGNPKLGAEVRNELAGLVSPSAKR